jgi:hypothetical protein
MKFTLVHVYILAAEIALHPLNNKGQVRMLIPRICVRDRDHVAYLKKPRVSFSR